MLGRDDLRDVGRYRTHDEPMQIVSGPLHDPKVHFEAPPSDRVPAEMDGFVAWFARSGPRGSAPLGLLERAALSHLSFESIHPFEDGNGRIGRAIAEFSIANHLGQPSLTALSATISLRRSDYYRALEAAQRQMEVSAWMAWFGGIALEAQQRTLAQIEFHIDKAKFMDRLRGKLNQRQEAAILRVLREGPDGFKGGLSAGKYAAITKASAPTATRDLAELVTLGAATRTGERKSTRYHLTVPLRRVGRVWISASGEVCREAAM
jgi:Fic family protein